MAIKQTAEGKWLVDAQPGGRGGKRFRKTLKTKAEAKAYEAWIATQVNQNAAWSPERRDTRHLSELIDLWHHHHGLGLKAGANTYSRLKLLCDGLGNPLAERFTVSMFTEYRTKRLAAGIAPNSVNREHAYLRSVFNELKRLGIWKRANPLAELRQFKVEERELSFLTLDQCRDLLASLRAARNKHAELIAKVCLATGARWTESEMLTIQRVRHGLIQFAGTKSGRVRNVPISEQLEEELKCHHRPDDTGNRLFEYAYSAFREAVDRIGLGLPEGQLTHVLRHTFASHFMMNGGNILTLQKILGHASLTMTMRYAHLAPEHLQEARTLNPLTALTLG